MPCTHNGRQNAQEITLFPHNIMKCVPNEQGIVHTRVITAYNVMVNAFDSIKSSHTHVIQTKYI